MTKKESEQKKSIAQALFNQGYSIKDISDKIGVSTNSISKWQASGNWQEKRAANNIDRKEVVAKCLRAIDLANEEFINKKEHDSSDFCKVADMTIKMSNAIQKLDPKESVVNIINVFTGFLNWLKTRLSIDPELTPELLKSIAHYQELYISENLN